MTVIIVFASVHLILKHLVKCIKIRHKIKINVFILASEMEICLGQLQQTLVKVGYL